MEIREGVQNREGKGIQRRAICGMPFGEYARRRFWHGRTLCATSSAIEVLRQAVQVLWGGVEENGGIDWVILKKHQVLLRCDNNGLVNPSCYEQESASALGRLGMPLLPQLARELGLVMTIVKNQKRARAQGDSAPQQGLIRGHPQFLVSDRDRRPGAFAALAWMPLGGRALSFRPMPHQ